MNRILFTTPENNKLLENSLRNLINLSNESISKELNERIDHFENLTHDIKISNGKYHLEAKKQIKECQESLALYDDLDKKRQELENEFLKHVELAKEIKKHNASTTNIIKEVNNNIDVKLN